MRTEPGIKKEEKPMKGEDVIAIINVVNLYPVAVDTQQWDIFDQIFTRDTEADFGGPAAWRDLAALKRDFETIHAPFSATLHTTSNHQVVVDGDRANCISHVHGRFLRDIPGDNMYEAGGWYDDRLVRTPDGWRIKSRIYRPIWAGGNPGVMETAPAVDGRRSYNSLIAEAKAKKVRHLEARAGRW
jgi:SnoaL-like domain